jgi:hypothetical protein
MKVPLPPRVKAAVETVQIIAAALGALGRVARWFLVKDEPHQVPLSRADEQRISRAQRCAGHEHEEHCSERGASEARRPHKPETPGSSPGLATNPKPSRRR